MSAPSSVPRVDASWSDKERRPPNRGSGDLFANGEPIDWPKCDLCGAVMEAVDSEPHVSRFACQNDAFTLSFLSCRHSDRYCAYITAHPIKEINEF